MYQAKIKWLQPRSGSLSRPSSHSLCPVCGIMPRSWTFKIPRTLPNGKGPSPSNWTTVPVLLLVASLAAIWKKACGGSGWKKTRWTLSHTTAWPSNSNCIFVLWAYYINISQYNQLYSCRCGIFNGYSDEAIRYIVNVCQDEQYANMSIFTQNKLFQCAVLKQASKEHQLWMLKRMVLTSRKMHTAISLARLTVVVNVWIRILHQKDMFEVPIFCCFLFFFFVFFCIFLGFFLFYCFVCCCCCGVLWLTAMYVIYTDGRGEIQCSLAERRC